MTTPWEGIILVTLLKGTHEKIWKCSLPLPLVVVRQCKMQIINKSNQSFTRFLRKSPVAIKFFTITETVKTYKAKRPTYTIDLWFILKEIHNKLGTVWILKCTSQSNQTRVTDKHKATATLNTDQLIFLPTLLQIYYSQSRQLLSIEIYICISNQLKVSIDCQCKTVVVYN